jgi:hypothetical protein
VASIFSRIGSNMAAEDSEALAVNPAVLRRIRSAIVRWQHARATAASLPLALALAGTSAHQTFVAVDKV